MKNRWVLSVLVMLALLLPAAASRTLAEGVPRDPIDIVLVIDNSGSMGGSGGNDIEGLRYAAARLLVDLAAEGDRVAVVQFDNGASVLGAEAACSAMSMAEVGAIDAGKCPLVEIDANSRSALLDAYQLKSAGGNTCMQYALGMSARLLAATAGSRPQAVLFLTDGRFECAGASGPSDLNTVIATLSQMNVVAYPIVLGRNVSDDVTARLADATGGRVFPATDADDLLPAFAAFYATLQPSRYAVPLEPPPNVNQVEFITTGEQKVTELNFVVAHNSLTGLSLNNEPLSPGGLPDGNGTYTVRQDNNNNGEPKYDIHQLRGNPLKGTWQLSLTGGVSRALAVVEAGVTPALDFPRSEQVFAARHVSQRDDGYLMVPIAVSDGQQDSSIPVNAPGQPLDNAPTNLNFRRVPRSDGRFDYDIRVGDSVNPLVLQRSFEIRPGNFPRLEIVEASPGAGSVPSHFEVRWNAADGAMPENSKVDMYVVDSSNGTVVWRAEPEDFDCAEGVCVHDGFSQPPGSSYSVWFLASAISNGTLFSDYAVDDLKSDPRLTVRNLPDTIDLAENPGPFTIEIAVQSETEPGNMTVELYSNGALAAVQPSLALMGELLPGSTVSAQLSFVDLAGLPTTGFSGELVLQADTIRVSPDRRPVVYRPRVELTGLDAIDLSLGNMGPYPVTARMVGGSAATTITARVENSSSGAISPHLNLQLQPGETTTGTIEFSRQPDLPANIYSSTVIFETGDGRPVEPASLPLTLNLEPANVEYTLEDGQLNFGYWVYSTRPITTTFQLTYENRPVNLRAEIEGSAARALRAVVMTPKDPTGPGPHEARISIMPNGTGGGLPTGEMRGDIRLYVDDPVGGTVSPTKPIAFQVNRPSYFKVFLWCDRNYPVETAQWAQSILCLILPRWSSLDAENRLETDWHEPSIIRLGMTLFFWLGVVPLGFVFFRNRLSPPKNGWDDYFISPPPPPDDGEPLPPPPPVNPGVGGVKGPGPVGIGSMPGGQPLRPPIPGGPGPGAPPRPPTPGGPGPGALPPRPPTPGGPRPPAPSWPAPPRAPGGVGAPRPTVPPPRPPTPRR